MAEAAAAARSISATRLPQSLINPYAKSSDAKQLHFCSHESIRRRRRGSTRVSRKISVFSPQSSSLFPSSDYSRRIGDHEDDYDDDQYRSNSAFPPENTDKKGRMNGIRSGSRRRIRISTSSDGRWKGNWTSNFIFSLEELHLHDLAEQGQENTLVFIDLSIQKHAGFGFSVDGKITSSLPRKCICCGSSYITDIDTELNVWVLPSSKRNHSLPDIGSGDPSVIYVKPGCEVDLDALVLDTIRLSASIKGTCKDSCDKIEPMIIPNWEEQKKPSFNMVDKRWAKLLELRKSLYAAATQRFCRFNK
ncbi:large ribosomal RNA subunit accumulation protein YCED homolog 2, chloroplastic isoform X1 [Impatiens glandulifera]|uniref:large ribosomal RNA subunit accumulation protein YCED homolog 2, chloroplastic isoform X1 n=1 Tax=Impatiens glandulifera TaxID=253017 RepID=UPI001FB1793E|nr:large ribosomal RNA subunit accumulation protein YCED homolog 2, chloroplastic isoform X1 [Impatiens glandulifera]